MQTVSYALRKLTQCRATHKLMEYCVHDRQRSTDCTQKSPCRALADLANSSSFHHTEQRAFVLGPSTLDAIDYSNASLSSNLLQQRHASSETCNRFTWASDTTNLSRTLRKCMCPPPLRTGVRHSCHQHERLPVPF